MRSGAIAAFVVLAVLVGCGRPAYNQSLDLMKNELTLYFGNLNSDAEQRKLDLKTPRAHVEDPISAGRVYSDFIWSADETLVVITGVECLRCKTKQTVPVYKIGSNPRVICPTCAAGDDKGDKATKAPPLLDKDMDLDRLKQRCGEKNVRKMFEPAPDPGPKNAMKATIVYVRRLWVYDAYGKVDDVGKGAAEGPMAGMVTDTAPYGESFIDIDGRPVASLGGSVQSAEQKTQVNYYAGGYHRLDSVYVGEIQVTYDGALKVVGTAKEEGVKPWNRARSLAGPQRYQTRTTSAK